MTLAIEPFYFLRHGQSDWNERGLCIGQQDRSLTPRGLEQAHRAAESVRTLPIGSIFSSPLIRAAKTAEIIALRRGLNVTVVAELAEVSLGEWEGKAEAEVASQYPQWVEGRLEPAGGETFAGLTERVSRAVNGCQRRRDGLPPLIVAHAGVFWALAILSGHGGIDPDHCCPYFFKPVERGWQLSKVS